jgi:HK97 family phage prohead protease
MEKNDAEARSGRQMRTLETKFETREASDGSEDLHIAGYFAVFDGIYDMGYQMSESIDPHAFDDAISGDVRFLIDHDTRLVLGRTSAHTGELRIDSHGLYGDVTINPKDQDAMNLYARVQRGDVNQCSFGFDILDEETEIREDGSIHWTIKKVKLYEVSVCTFPAYETTEVSARMNDAKNIRKRELDAWKARMMAKIEGPKGE